MKITQKQTSQNNRNRNKICPPSPKKKVRSRKSNLKRLHSASDLKVFSFKIEPPANLLKPTATKQPIPEKVPTNAHKIEIETDRQTNSGEKPNLKRKPDVDLSTLMPNTEKKKNPSEKAKSIDNTSSPKSIKSNISEKKNPIKSEEEKKSSKNSENVKSLRSEIEELKTNKKINADNIGKKTDPHLNSVSTPVNQLPPKTQVADNELPLKKAEEPKKNTMIIEEASKKNAMIIEEVSTNQNNKSEKKSNEASFFEKPKVQENTKMEEEPCNHDCT